MWVPTHRSHKEYHSNGQDLQKYEECGQFYLATISNIIYNYYHQECIRESTQEHTVVWQIRFD